DPGRLAAALDRFPREVRVAVEFRDDSWYTDEVRRVLEERGSALCLADSPHRRTPDWRTADWGFVRFHEGKATPPPCYGARALADLLHPLADPFAGPAVVHPRPAGELADVAHDGLDLPLHVRRGVDEDVGSVEAGEPDLLDLVGLEALGQELGVGSRVPRVGV